MKPIVVGERIIVQGMSQYEARVKDVVWLADESRWCFVLDWGIHGTSKVYDHDENRVWYRYKLNN